MPKAFGVYYREIVAKLVLDSFINFIRRKNPCLWFIWMNTVMKNWIKQKETNNAHKKNNFNKNRSILGGRKKKSRDNVVIS